MSCKCFNEFQFAIKPLSPNLYVELIKWNWGMSGGGGKKWEGAGTGHFSTSAIIHREYWMSVWKATRQLYRDPERVINVETDLLNENKIASVQVCVSQTLKNVQ